MTIDEVIDTFLEGRRLKEPTLTAAHRTFNYLSKNTVGYTPLELSPRSLYSYEPHVHHDLIQHRSMGARTDAKGELTTWAHNSILKLAGKRQTMNKADVHSDYMDMAPSIYKSLNKRLYPNSEHSLYQPRKFEDIDHRKIVSHAWRRAVKAGHIAPDGRQGPNYRKTEDYVRAGVRGSGVRGSVNKAQDVVVNPAFKKS